MDNCNFHSECYFGMYCNAAGKCVKDKTIGDRCSSDEQCGGEGLCVYQISLSPFGVCVAMLSKSDGDLILPMYKNDLNQGETKLYVSWGYMDKICRNGYVNATNGRCNTPIKSLNKVKLPNLTFRVKFAPPTQTVRHQTQRCLGTANVGTIVKESNIAMLKEVTMNGNKHSHKYKYILTLCSSKTILI